MYKNIKITGSDPAGAINPTEKCCCNDNIIDKYITTAEYDRILLLTEILFRSKIYGFGDFGGIYLGGFQCGEQAEHLRNQLRTIGVSYWDIRDEGRTRSMGAALWGFITKLSGFKNHSVVTVTCVCKKGDCPYTGAKYTFDPLTQSIGSYSDYVEKYPTLYQ